MTLTGARGQTAQEMTAVLRTPPEAALLDKLTKAGNASGDQLLLTQSLWIDRGFTLLPDFIRASQEQFRAAPEAADFSKAPENARAAINRWVTEQTKSKIADLFAPGTLTRDTRLVLASAVYFNGKWQSKFDPKATSQAPFHTSAPTPVQTPFMNQTARFPYAETPTAQVLELPYAGGSLAFDVILPKAGTPLSTLEDALRSDGLSVWLGHLQRKQVAVSLPKFRAESAFSLKDALSALGMPIAFSSAADFSGIDGRRRSEHLTGGPQGLHRCLRGRHRSGRRDRCSGQPDRVRSARHVPRGPSIPLPAARYPDRRDLIRRAAGRAEAVE